MKYIVAYITIFICCSAQVEGLSQAEFVQNKGQWPEQVTVRADVPSGVLWAEKNAFTWLFYDPSILENIHPTEKKTTAPALYRQHAYRVNFAGSNPLVEVNGNKPQSHYYNYFLGSDSSKWATRATPYSMVEYHDIYSRIDLDLYSKNNAIKYDFIIHPEGDAAQIVLEFTGDVGCALSNGELKITTSVGTITELKPFAYQLINGKMTEVSCSFVLDGNLLSFALGEYNSQYDLVIDPEIAFSTFIGSTASNFGFTACNDSQDNLISGAAVFAPEYPTTLGAYSSDFNSGAGNYMDIAISKFSPDGSQLLYSTYLGGSQQETGHSLIADSNDNFILMGVTGSGDFPSTAGVYQPDFVGGPLLLMGDFFTSGHPDGTDLFVTKFSSTGALSASTFIGDNFNDGLNYADKLFYNYGDAFRGEVNVDANNNIFVASVTTGTFPTTANAFQPVYGGGNCDGVLLKLNPSLSTLLWSTYVGGGSSDACYAIEFADDGKLIAGGGTKSVDFPHCADGHDTSQNGDVDGFLFTVNPTSLTVTDGTFVGTTGYDQVYFVQSDYAGFIYVLGQTDGNMTVSPGVYGDANSGQFIRKFSSDLLTMEWNTTIGTGSGEIDISPTAFLVSDCYQIYFSGWGGDTNGYCGNFYTCYASNSTTNGLTTTGDAFQSSTDGSDFYLCVLAPDAVSLEYASFLGGSLSNEHVDGGTSRFDKDGSVYQAVCAGCGSNSDFPTTAGAWSAENPSNNCNIAVFKFNLGGVDALLQIDGPPQACVGEDVQFINNSIGATDFEWWFGDGDTSFEEEPDHVYDLVGFYTITLIATDDSGCLEADTTSIVIEIVPGVNLQVEDVDPICDGETAQLLAIGSANLSWIPDITLSDPSIPNPIASPTETTTYYAVDFNECAAETLSVTVVVIVPETGIGIDQEICIGESAQLQASGGGTYSWTPAGTLDDAASESPLATPLDTTVYTCVITIPEGCEVTETMTVFVVFDAPGGHIYPDINMCIGNSALLQANDGNSYSWWPAATLDEPLAQNPTATPTDTTTYTVTITNACGTGTDQVTVNVIAPAAEAFGGGTVCLGNWAEAWASGGVDYFWQPVGFCSEPMQDSTLLSPPESMWFHVVVTDQYGCAAMDSVYVFVIPLPQVDAGPNQYINIFETAQLFGNTNSESFYWEPPIDLSCTECYSPWTATDSTMYYYLVVTDHNGCMAIDSVLVTVYFPMWVPNTITPNGDGINDYFQAVSEFVTGFNLKIFDRWGLLIFETSDINEVWTGGIDGYYVQNDTYLWIIEYDTRDRKEKLVGHVNVVR